MATPNNKILLKNSHRFTDDSLPLFLMAGGFGMWRAWRRVGLDKAIATYDVFVRDLPANRNYFVFTGLEEVLADLLKWKFSKSDIQTLLKYDVIDKAMAKELASFKFDIDVEAMPEGTICFANEPMIKFTGPLYKLELLYLYIVNAVSSNTIFSSKCARVVNAAQGKTFVMPATRSHGFESCFKCMRGLYICGGTPSSSQLAFWNKYNLKPQAAFIAQTHAFIKSFDGEEEAIIAYGETFKDAVVPILVDTYDFENGVEVFISAAKKLKHKHGRIPLLMYIDSGDFVKRSFYARKKLDAAGMKEVKILVSGNIDEYRLEKIVAKKAPIDLFLGITEIVNSADAPILEVVHKLAEIKTERGTRSVMKLTHGKKSYPGRKQVFRIKDKQGHYIKDIIGLEKDKIANSEKLLEKYLDKGKLIKDLPKLEDIKAYYARYLALMPKKLKSLKPASYPVELSAGMKKLIANFKHQ